MWKSQNTRFIFSPEAAEESSQTCSTESRQSAPSRSKNTREPSSACASQSCLFGMMCEPSAQTIPSAPECSTTYANTATRLSLPVASLARIFRAREKARAYAAREADFGLNTRVSFARFDPVSYSWKIPHSLFRGDLAKYSQTWPRYGILEHGACFQLRPWVQDISANAFGGLSGGAIETKEESATWPTVGTQTMGGCSGSFEKLKKLEEAGNLTPEERRAMSSHLTGGKDTDTANCGLLNPDWVEWLMGWPLGWTDIAITSGVFYWLDLSDDPADWTPPLMARITTRKKHRVPRINTLGNGQVPLCAAVAFVWGFEILCEVEECFQDVDEETSKLMRKAKAALEKAGGAE